MDKSSWQSQSKSQAGFHSAFLAVLFLWSWFTDWGRRSLAPKSGGPKVAPKTLSGEAGNTPLYIRVSSSGLDFGVPGPPPDPPGVRGLCKFIGPRMRALGGKSRTSSGGFGVGDPPGRTDFPGFSGILDHFCCVLCCALVLLVWFSC